MRYHRFFVGQDLSAVLGKNPAVFDYVEENGRNLINQWKNVFRYKVGDEVLLFDGKDEYLAAFLDLTKEAKFLLKEKTKSFEKKNREVWLGLSMLKGEHTEMVIEKATELGVSGIILVQTDRVIKKGANLERLQKIAIEAAEQCGRVDVPEISVSEDLEKLLESDFDQKIVLNIGGERLEKINTDGKVLILVGPEGGWSESEEKMFKEKGLKVKSIGENVLRAETAAIVGVSLLCL